MKYTHNNLFTDIYGTKLLVTVIIVHLESVRSNAQNAIAFARRNRPRVNSSGEFCVCLFGVCVRVRACNRTYKCACDRAVRESPIKAHQKKITLHGQWSRSFISFVLLHGVCNCHKRCNTSPQ